MFNALECKFLVSQTWFGKNPFKIISINLETPAKFTGILIRIQNAEATWILHLASLNNWDLKILSLVANERVLGTRAVEFIELPGWCEKTGQTYPGLLSGWLDGLVHGLCRSGGRSQTNRRFYHKTRRHPKWMGKYLCYSRSLPCH